MATNPTDTSLTRDRTPSAPNRTTTVGPCGDTEAGGEHVPPANASPFHRGERAIQARLGVRERTERLGRRMIRDFMPEQHREFFAQLPFAWLGARDGRGLPWASIVVGGDGFIDSPDPRHLRLRARCFGGDPLHAVLRPGAAVGILGIDYATRRRNRVSARVVEVGHAALLVAVEQSFGNCPKYIQARRARPIPGRTAAGVRVPAASIAAFDARTRALMESADHFHIATFHREAGASRDAGADVSHRGGRPGFVSVIDARTIEFPDYAGNHHFSTLGNIALNGRAGLTFIDVDNGDVLYLTGTAVVDWDVARAATLPGAERIVRFRLDEGRILREALPIAWTFESYSPYLP